MKLYSWNVNGIRATSAKPDWKWFKETDADIIGFQETKANPEQLDSELLEHEDFYTHWLAANKKGYSGVAVFSKPTPIAVSYELPDARWHGEGRLIHIEYDKFHFLNVYFPNGQRDDERLAYKLGFYDAFLDYSESLRKTKPIVACGDFNTAHTNIDIARPKENEKVSGFLPIERAWLDKFIGAGYIDTFRHVNPDEKDQYSWWSYRMRARERNVGWRIDYFFVSNELKDNISAAWIEQNVHGSDHCPVALELIF